jgi:hypothetical protein
MHLYTANFCIKGAGSSAVSSFVGRHRLLLLLLPLLLRLEDTNAAPLELVIQCCAPASHRLINKL